MKTSTALEDPLAAEEAAFRRQRARLLKRYKGQYVALYRERVIAHGPDDRELVWRVFQKLGDVPFYIARVEDEPTVYEFPSPEGGH